MTAPAYTPINWQTGDVITADKLNKMDRGWGVESAQLFSETVTTEAQEGLNYAYAPLLYVQQISSPTIIVTFDGTEYVCSAFINADGAYEYGGHGTTEPDFTNYPFLIVSGVSVGMANDFITETAGDHAITVVGDSIVTSSDFSGAVGKCLPILKITLGETTFQEVENAIQDGFFVYGWDADNNRMFYALCTGEDNGSYILYALTKQTQTVAPTTATFAAFSVDGPLYAV